MILNVQYAEGLHLPEWFFLYCSSSVLHICIHVGM